MSKKLCFAFVMMVCFQVNLFAQKDFTIYGYGSLYCEKVGPWSTAPSGTKGDPLEFAYPHFNLMMQSKFGEDVKVYVNIAGFEQLEVRNFWGEFKISDKLKIRTGKIYRPFGLYNELLDAAPTYLGMEPPEHLDGDHLLLPRFGKVMIHGGSAIGNSFLKYSYMLDSDEKMTGQSSDGKSTLAHSWDVNLSILNDRLLIGHSGFLGNERGGSSVKLGDGPPVSGVLPWMVSDKYQVFNGYLKAIFGNFTLEAEYAIANHNAIRDTGSIVTIFKNTTLNANQLANFYGAGYSGNHSGVDVITKANYKVTTYYIRMGYRIAKEKVPFKFADVIPYFFFEYYSNPETIAKKTWGGDNEAGLADNGKFYKPTVGIAFRPTSTMAIKIDASSHFQKMGGVNANYKEIRMDISYTF